MDISELLEHMEKRGIERKQLLDEIGNLREEIDSVRRHVPRLVGLLQQTPEFQAVKSGREPKDLLQVTCDVLNRLLENAGPDEPPTNGAALIMGREMENK